MGNESKIRTRRWLQIRVHLTLVSQCPSQLTGIYCYSRQATLLSVKYEDLNPPSAPNCSRPSLGTTLLHHGVFWRQLGGHHPHFRYFFHPLYDPVRQQPPHASVRGGIGVCCAKEHDVCSGPGCQVRVTVSCCTQRAITMRPAFRVVGMMVLLTWERRCLDRGDVDPMDRQDWLY